MRVGHLELFVAEPAKSARFYVEVLGAVAGPVQGGGSFAWVELGGLALLFRPESTRAPTAGRPAYGDRGPALVLHVDGLEAELARLAAAGLQPVGDDGGCPTFQDPDGHWIQLVEAPGD